MTPVLEDPSNTKEREPPKKHRRVDAESSSTDVDWERLVCDLNSLIKDSDMVDRVVKLLTHDPDSSEKFVALPPVNDKIKRRELHALIREQLAPVGLSDTISEGYNKIIRVWHKSFAKDMPNFNKFERGQATRVDSSATKKRYLRFVLYKENMDTGFAIQKIQGHFQSRKGRGGKMRLGFAGNKDKRGVTSQFITVPGHTSPEMLCKWNERNGEGGGQNVKSGQSLIRIGNFVATDEEMRLGTLKGNRFDVVLRNVRVKDLGSRDMKAYLEEAASAVERQGFVNYFGMQRFGKFHDTHLTGIAILKGDYEQAVDIIMSVKLDERQDFIEAKTKWTKRFDGTTDASTERETQEKAMAKTLLKVFRKGTSEASILSSLMHEPLNYKRAFMSLPKTLRMMFVHAFQSYLWNHVASYRFSHESGNTVWPGDLVYIDSIASLRGVARVLSMDEALSGKFTLDDVVLPLVGSNTTYPANSCGDELKKMLSEHGLSVEVLQGISDKSLNCSGDYRRMVCKSISPVKCTVLTYTDPLEPLLQTDLMKLKNIPLQGKNNHDEANKKLVGVVVGFSLPSSAYATIFLREMMKRPTSLNFQKTLRLDE